MALVLKQIEGRENGEVRAGGKKSWKGKIFHYKGPHRSVKNDIQLHSVGNRGLVVCDVDTQELLLLFRQTELELGAG